MTAGLMVGYFATCALMFVAFGWPGRLIGWVSLTLFGGFAWIGVALGQGSARPGLVWTLLAIWAGVSAFRLLLPLIIAEWQREGEGAR